MSRKKSHNRIPKDIAEVVRDRADGACEMLLHPHCVGMAQQMHHRQMRSQGGEHTVENLIHICAACHHYAHMHPAISYTHGYLVKSHGDPAEVPVTYRGQPVILTADGQVEHYFKPRNDAGLSS